MRVRAPLRNAGPAPSHGTVQSASERSLPASWDSDQRGTVQSIEHQGVPAAGSVPVEAVLGEYARLFFISNVAAYTV